VDPRTLVTLLESPYQSYTGTVDAREVVLAGLKWPTEYWAGLAIGWLEQGAPTSKQIAQELQRLGSTAKLSQGLKHRAFTLARQLMQALPIEELDMVRVVAIHRESREHEGTESVKRQPRVGDVGAVVHVYSSAAGKSLFAVEAVNKEGLTLWVADFQGTELKLEAKHDDAGA
jgi:hypothetical protein